jgi:cytochrome b
MFHWLFALSFVGAYLTAETERWLLLHISLGYTMAGLLVFRLVYGVVGPRPFRLISLLGKLRAAPAWFQTMRTSLLQPTAPWRQGQNLVMPLITVVILLLVVPLTLSGYGTYHEWGGEAFTDALEELHEFFGELMLLVVLAHIAWLVVLSGLRRTNMAKPMLTGCVSGAGPDLVPANRTALAALMLVVVMAWFTWQALQNEAGLIPSGTNVQYSEPWRHDDDEDD